MAADSGIVHNKKRLAAFHADLLRTGCVKGFRHFAMHMRGREELICSVINTPSIPILLSAGNSPAISMTQARLRSSLCQSSSITMSQKLQRRLSGYGSINIGLPPASPSNEEVEGEEGTTMFLIAAYARYSRPYVWVRSNHERIIPVSDSATQDQSEKDYPLNLTSTAKWTEEDVKVWDIVAELVHICTEPCPPNPFDVDLDYFAALPTAERFLASGAMVGFLRQLLAGSRHAFDRRVLQDVQKICHIHFQAMAELIHEGMLLSDILPETTPPEPHPLLQQGAPSYSATLQPLPPLQLNQNAMYNYKY